VNLFHNHSCKSRQRC